MKEICRLWKENDLVPKRKKMVLGLVYIGLVQVTQLCVNQMCLK